MTTDFGRDTYCLDSLRTGRMASGPMLVGQRCYHHLITPRGTLHGGEDEASFGFDVSGEIGKLVEPGYDAALKSKIDAELSKDPAILRTETSVFVSQVGAAVSCEVTVIGYTEEGPFRLVVGVSEVTTELLKLEEA